MKTSPPMKNRARPTRLFGPGGTWPCGVPLAGPPDPPRTGFRSGLWAWLAISALTIWALAVVGRGFAQQNNGSPDGLYTVPDVGETAGATRESTANRAARSYLNSMDPQSEKYRRDVEKTEARHRTALPRTGISVKEANSSAAGGGAGESALTPRLSERAWLTILLAGVGLLVSLAAGGYAWWSRLQRSKTNGIVLLALPRGPAAKHRHTEKQGRPSKHRAA